MENQLKAHTVLQQIFDIIKGYKWYRITAYLTKEQYDELYSEDIPSVINFDITDKSDNACTSTGTISTEFDVSGNIALVIDGKPWGEISYSPTETRKKKLVYKMMHYMMFGTDANFPYMKTQNMATREMVKMRSNIHKLLNDFNLELEEIELQAFEVMDSEDSTDTPITGYKADTGVQLEDTNWYYTITALMDSVKLPEPNAVTPSLFSLRHNHKLVKVLLTKANGQIMLQYPADDKIVSVTLPQPEFDFVSRLLISTSPSVKIRTAISNILGLINEYGSICTKDPMLLGFTERHESPNYQRGSGDSRGRRKIDDTGNTIATEKAVRNGWSLRDDNTPRHRANVNLDVCTMIWTISNYIRWESMDDFIRVMHREIASLGIEFTEDDLGFTFAVDFNDPSVFRCCGIEDGVEVVYWVLPCKKLEL